MWVEEYRPGKFRARRRVDGRMVSKSFGSRAAAWAWLEDGTASAPTLPAAASDGPTAPSVPAPRSDNATPTLWAFIDMGGYSTLHMRPSTKASTEGILRKHVLPRWGHMPLDQITHLQIQTWIQDLATEIVKPDTKATRAPKTVKLIYSTTKLVLDAAVRAGAISTNPAIGVKLPKIEHHEMRFLTTDEVLALSAAMPSEFRALPLVLGFAGLRIGEAFGLRWGRVDLFRGRLDIVEAVTEVNGVLTYGQPKTARGRRTVPIPRTLVYALRDHQTAAGGNVAPDAFVFAGYANGAVRYRNFRTNVWDPAVTKAVADGTPSLAGVTPHALRHTAVSLWIAAGATPKEVAMRAGHSSVAFSFDRYGHLFESGEEVLNKKLDALISQGRGAA